MCDESIHLQVLFIRIASSEKKTHIQVNNMQNYANTILYSNSLCCRTNLYPTLPFFRRRYKNMQMLLNPSLELMRSLVNFRYCNCCFSLLYNTYYNIILFNLLFFNLDRSIFLLLKSYDLLSYYIGYSYVWF